MSLTNLFNRRIFSIGISTFELLNIDNDFLCDHVSKICKEKKGEFFKTELDIKTDCIKNLNDIVIEESQKILDGMIENGLVYIKRIWGNHNLNDLISAPHSHRDSFLSAVYYPKSTDGKIHFYSPWSDGLLAHVPYGDVKNHNEFNSSFYELDVKTGWLVIFPGNLCHFVTKSNNDRYSIAYDIGIKND